MDKIIYCNCDNPDISNFIKYFTINFIDLGIKKLTYSFNDFRNEENIKLLKEADIVITNPPFSLFKEYVDQLIEYDKQFLIIGSIMAVKYKETFKLIKENKLWLGVNNIKSFKEPNGNIKKFGNINGYSNIKYKKRNEELILYKKYKGNEKDYPKYDNYNAININKIKEIPIDYNGEMGVPITFAEKYNPNQFELIGKISNGIINERKIFERFIIKRKK